jgi:isopenicillin N synthase-like dioxygenase
VYSLEEHFAQYRCVTPAVPVIDIGALLSDDSAGLRALAREIGAAARKTGFFSVVNHGVPAELIADTFAQSATFFAQPLALKAKTGIESSRGHRGYARDGYESFDIGPDQNLWPDGLPAFKATLQRYYAALLALTVEIHRPIALDLGLDEHFFARAFDGTIAIARLLCYPPHPGTFEGTPRGSAPHTDYGNVTFLAQDDAGGLELQMRDGTWVGITPVEGTFVCNIGDCLMRWSNDVYVSNLRRTVNRSMRAGYSIAFFGDPAADALVSCVPSCSDAAHPPKYAPITYGEYLQRRLSPAHPSKED